MSGLTYRLYSYWRSSSAWRVRIGLAMKGLPYQYVAVNLLAGEQDAPPHVERSPLHQVPVLEVIEGGRPSLRLIQSMAILEWLDEMHPQIPLLPDDQFGRARVRALAEVVNSSIQPYQTLAALRWLKGRLPAGGELEWVRGWIGRGLASLEALAPEGAGRFCYGDRPGLADCYLVPQLHAARRFELDLAPFPTLRRIEAACAELPAFQAAHPDRQPDAPPPERRPA